MTTHNLSAPVTATKFPIFLATVLSFPLLTIYWMLLLQVIPLLISPPSGPQDPAWLTPLIITFYLPFLAIGHILSNLSLYLLLSLATLVVATIGLLKSRPGKLQRAWLLLLIGGTLAFPFVQRYRPALAAATGYEAQLVTKPTLLRGAVKTTQAWAEQTPCTYTLLGWDNDNQFYYESTCQTEKSFWRYNPAQPTKPLQISASPENLSDATLAKTAVLKMVWGAGIDSKGNEAITRPILLKSNGLPSPDGRWTAIVTQHVYGPQDVLILSKSE